MLAGYIRTGLSSLEDLSRALFQDQPIPLTIQLDGSTEVVEVVAKITGVHSDGRRDTNGHRNGWVIKGHFRPGLEGRNGSIFEALCDVPPTGEGDDSRFYIKNRVE